jgi:hypothetical protein
MQYFTDSDKFKISNTNQILHHRIGNSFVDKALNNVSLDVTSSYYNNNASYTITVYHNKLPIQNTHNNLISYSQHSKKTTNNKKFYKNQFKKKHKYFNKKIFNKKKENKIKYNLLFTSDYLQCLPTDDFYKDLDIYNHEYDYPSDYDHFDYASTCSSSICNCPSRYADYSELSEDSYDRYERYEIGETLREIQQREEYDY